MKKLSLILVICFVYMTSVHAQTSERRDVGNFKGINVCCGIEVFLREGNSSTIEIKGDSESVSRITTQVKGGILKIGLNKSSKKKGQRATVYISMSDISELEANSSGKIRGSGNFRAKDIKIQTNSSGSINLDLKAKKVTCSSNSSGKITLQGTADQAKLSNNSGAEIRMKGFTADKVEASSNSGASIEIGVRDYIKAEANSGGKIRFYGNPSKTDITSNSGGSVKKKSDRR